MFLICGVDLIATTACCPRLFRSPQSVNVRPARKLVSMNPPPQKGAFYARRSGWHSQSRAPRTENRNALQTPTSRVTQESSMSRPVPCSSDDMRVVDHHAESVRRRSISQRFREKLALHRSEGAKETSGKTERTASAEVTHSTADAVWTLRFFPPSSTSCGEVSC